MSTDIILETKNDSNFLTPELGTKQISRHVFFSNLKDNDQMYTDSPECNTQNIYCYSHQKLRRQYSWKLESTQLVLQCWNLFTSINWSIGTIVCLTSDFAVEKFVNQIRIYNKNQILEIHIVIALLSRKSFFQLCFATISALRTAFVSIPMMLALFFR